jgi:hypothetical protein
MSRSYIVIYPENSLEPLPNKVYIIEALKHPGFLLETNTEWVNPNSKEIELFYTVGKDYPIHHLNRVLIWLILGHVHPQKDMENFIIY